MAENKIFDLSNIRYVKRIIVGQNDPNVPYKEEDYQKANELLNKCLNEIPKGKIIGIERNFHLFNLGEHQVVLQWLTYHVGFERKPMWLEE